MEVFIRKGAMWSLKYSRRIPAYKGLRSSVESGWVGLKVGWREVWRALGCCRNPGKKAGACDCDGSGEGWRGGDRTLDQE